MKEDRELVFSDREGVWKEIEMKSIFYGYVVTYGFWNITNLSDGFSIQYCIGINCWCRIG